MPDQRRRTKALKENDVGYYKGQRVRLLFPADPLPGWIAVRLIGEMGGHLRTGKRVHVKDVSKFDKLVLKVPRTR